MPQIGTQNIILNIILLKQGERTSKTYIRKFTYRSLRPVVVKPFELLDDIDGYSDKNLPRKNQEFFTARDIGPRFAKIGSFEYEYGTRWKQLHELYEQKEEALKREMAMEEEKLEAQMEFARYEHETELLRERKYFNIIKRYCFNIYIYIAQAM